MHSCVGIGQNLYEYITEFAIIFSQQDGGFVGFQTFHRISVVPWVRLASPLVHNPGSTDEVLKVYEGSVITLALRQSDRNASVLREPTQHNRVSFASDAQSYPFDETQDKSMSSRASRRGGGAVVRSMCRSCLHSLTEHQQTCASCNVGNLYKCGRLP